MVKRNSKEIAVIDKTTDVKIMTVDDIYDIIYYDESKSKNFVRFCQKNTLRRLERTPVRTMMNFVALG